MLDWIIVLPGHPGEGQIVTENAAESAALDYALEVSTEWGVEPPLPVERIDSGDGLISFVVEGEAIARKLYPSEME